MKKIFTLIAMTSAALSMSAAAPELLFDGNPVQAGKTYETGYTVEVIDFGDIKMYNYTRDTKLTLRGTKGAAVVLDVEATDPIQVCGIDGVCVKNTTFHKTGTLGAVPGDVISTDGNTVTVKLQIEGILNTLDGSPASELLPYTTVNVSAYYTSSPEEKATATVVLTNKPDEEVGGIGAVTAADNYVRLSAGRTLAYNVAVPTKLNIYGVTGNLVDSRLICNTGTISLDLPAGMYIFQAGRVSGKIVVR